ncbi:MAG: aminotransferase class III-fold pyridoxal phosphate-dependent enzyme [Candidatus Niyogibacteria bacterium]|nr:aminotransferase class III-fold pyridoxal phosphate-dependent enzyme [Candidatus Niyogibacteria bacterium]
MFEMNWHEKVKNRTSKEVLSLNKQYGITTTTVDYPFVPWKADKEFLFDRHDKKYIDFHSGIGCNNLGYRHRGILEAVSRQIYEHGIIGFVHHDYPNPWASELSEALCRITPGAFPKKVFFASTGTEAVEAAAKMCLKRNPQKKKFFSFKNGFHGRTLGALSFTNSKEIQKKDFPFGLGEGNVHYLPFPEQNTGIASFRWGYYFSRNDIKLHEFNGIIFELVQGEGGINVVDKKNIVDLIKILRENGLAIIVDEVQTGIMRTGKMFACNHYGIEPDIICLAKGLGSGMPISATVARAEFDFPEKGCHSNTHGGNALASVVALETLRIFSSWTAQDYSDLEEKIKILSEFSDGGLGMMQRIVCDSKKERDEIINRAYYKGLILLGAGEKNIRLMPPVIISKESLKEARKILESCY